MTNYRYAENIEQWHAIDDKRRHPRFPLRLTDREAAQLKHLAEATSESMHQFCINAVRIALSEKPAMHSVPKPAERTGNSHRVQCPNCNHALFDLLT